MRNLSEAAASLLYITALSLVPLSLNAALLQASPMVVTVGAALVLNEQVGWRRWMAILVGFAGVLIILRPGAEGFEPAALLTVACVIVLAARDLATRMMPPGIGTFQLTTWAYLSLVPAGLLLMGLSGHEPQGVIPARWSDLGGALVFGLVGYHAVTVAMRTGEVAVVAPLRYSRLVFALVLAGVVFGERPDRSMLPGAMLVIEAGLYTIARETRRKRALSLSPEPR